MLALKWPKIGIGTNFDLELGVVEEVKDNQVVLVQKVQPRFVKLQGHSLEHSRDLHLVEMSIQKLQSHDHFEGEELQNMDEALRPSKSLGVVALLGLFQLMDLGSLLVMVSLSEALIS